MILPKRDRESVSVRVVKRKSVIFMEKDSDIRNGCRFRG